jgi:hypothetical protein
MITYVRDDRLLNQNIGEPNTQSENTVGEVKRSEPVKDARSKH